MRGRKGANEIRGCVAGQVGKGARKVGDGGRVGLHDFRVEGGGVFCLLEGLGTVLLACPAEAVAAQWLGDLRP